MHTTGFVYNITFGAIYVWKCCLALYKNIKYLKKYTKWSTDDMKHKQYLSIIVWNVSDISMDDHMTPEKTDIDKVRSDFSTEVPSPYSGHENLDTSYEEADNVQHEYKNHNVELSQIVSLQKVSIQGLFMIGVF